MDPREAPHFHNEVGVAEVRVGAKDFMCVGALPPFDHPHVFINMGDMNEAVCPYCATRFLFDPSLDGGCEPPECAYTWERETDFAGRQSRSGADPVDEGLGEQSSEARKSDRGAP